TPLTLSDRRSVKKCMKTWPFSLDVSGREKPTTTAPKSPTSLYVPIIGCLNKRSRTSHTVRNTQAVSAIPATTYMNRAKTLVIEDRMVMITPLYRSEQMSKHSFGAFLFRYRFLFRPAQKTYGCSFNHVRQKSSASWPGRPFCFVVLTYSSMTGATALAHRASSSGESFIISLPLETARSRASLSILFQVSAVLSIHSLLIF